MKKFLYSFLAVILLVWTCSANVIADSNGGISSEVSADYSNGKYGSEVYYLANRARGGISKSDIAVFKRNGTPVAVWYELDERCRERELTEAEYNEFVSYIQKLDADNLPDFIPSEHGIMVFDGSEHKYIHISDGTKSEVYMNNPGVSEYEDNANQIYNSIIGKFRSLFEMGGIKTYYDIAGAELLINNEDHCVRSVYKNGDDFRVLIKDRKNSTYKDEKLEWHSFKNNVVGDIVDEPDGFTMEEVSEDFRGISYLISRNLQPTSELNKYYVLKDQHTIGIYDTEIHSTTNFVKSPVLIYDNSYVWVDEQESKVYIVVNNDLISLPIKKSLSDEICDIEVILNGERLEFDDPLFIRNDRTLVPFRKIFESLGYEVSWKDTDKSIYAEKSNNIICLHIDNPRFLVNYKAVSSDVAPELINSIAYVPLRIICEYSDCDVLWQEEDRTVIINSK